MDWGKVRFFWAEVAQNFTRNLTMAVTAIGTVAIAIVLLGVFLFLRQSFDLAIATVAGQISVRAYLKDSTPQDEIDSMMQALRADPRVASVRFIDKKHAMADLRKQMRGQMNLDVINVNPLPDTVEIVPRDPYDAPAIASAVELKPIVAKVNDGGNVTNELLKVDAVFSAAGLAIVAMLILATVLLIYNTIRLTVFARQREIHIMQLVGATRWTVRWPFVFEGILSGAIGAIFGLIVLSIAYRTLVPKIELNLPFLPLKLESVPAGHLALELLLVGTIVGMLASLVSVGRYLRTT
ncbi:MAG TPA: permease-like cell division protein FtsX [Candidatus Eremiobacteraceae bacterium]|nr:permease-like cell division protein FtsX [Candidatus Eremiobacteraceae bacterium]